MAKNTEKLPKLSFEKSDKSNIEQIREILFGEKSVEWERRINQIMQDLRELDQKLIDLEKNLSETNLRIDSLSEQFKQSAASWEQLHDFAKLMNKELTQKIEQLRDIKLDRNLMAKALNEWSQKIKQSPAE